MYVDDGLIIDMQSAKGAAQQLVKVLDCPMAGRDCPCASCSSAQFNATFERLDELEAWARSAQRERGRASPPPIVYARGKAIPEALVLRTGDELLLDQTMLTWERAARKRFGIVSVVPHYAFKLIMRKVTSLLPQARTKKEQQLQLQQNQQSLSAAASQQPREGASFFQQAFHRETSDS